MAFMRPFISERKELLLLTDDGMITTCYDEGIDLPVGSLSSDGTLSDSWEALTGHEPDGGCEEINRMIRLFPNCEEFEVVDKYYGYLSAPGYMDRTDYVLGDTRADVVQQLLNMYFDSDEDYMDVEELQQMHWLEEIAGKVRA